MRPIIRAILAVIVIQAAVGDYRNAFADETTIIAYYPAMNQVLVRVCPDSTGQNCTNQVAIVLSDNGCTIEFKYSGGVGVGPSQDPYRCSMSCADSDYPQLIEYYLNNPKAFEQFRQQYIKQYGYISDDDFRKYLQEQLNYCEGQPQPQTSGVATASNSNP